MSYIFKIDPAKYPDLVRKLQEWSGFIGWGAPYPTHLKTWWDCPGDSEVGEFFVELSRRQVNRLGRKLSASAIEDAFGLKISAENLNDGLQVQDFDQKPEPELKDATGPGT